jgi:hypothetical protein
MRKGGNFVMMPWKVLFLSAGFALPFRPAFSQIVLSEIMYDPSGSENSDEFVELVNVSPGDTIDLHGWRLGDGTGDDALQDAGNGLRLGPNRYAVILDPDYFGHSTSYDSLIPPGCLVLTVDGSTFGSGGFSNTQSETVTIFDPEGRAVDRCRYHTGNRPGYSDERIDLNSSGGFENWADSYVFSGTPGRRNSVARVPCNLQLVDLFYIPSPAGGALNAVVLNEGTMAVSGFTLHFFADENIDSVLEVDEMIGTVSHEPTLAPGDSTVISIPGDLPPGVHRIAARVLLEADEKPEDNLRFYRICIGYPENALVINEIMFYPESGCGEWIELLNVQHCDVDLADWSIADRDSLYRVKLCPASCTIPAGGYLVITGDSSLPERHPGLNGKIQVVPQLTGLNNDSDSVNLYDPSGNRIDHMDYSDIQGKAKGISLERIDPYRDGNDRNNWYLCIAWNGATPGETNSVYSKSYIPDGSMEFEPNPFSPDGDGLEEAVGISFSLPFERATVRLSIYDIRGRIIRHLERNGQTGKTGRFVWDGRDDLDRPVTVGQYIVFLEASEQEGGRVFCRRSVLVLARSL